MCLLNVTATRLFSYWQLHLMKMFKNLKKIEKKLGVLCKITKNKKCHLKFESVILCKNMEHCNTIWAYTFLPNITFKYINLKMSSSNCNRGYTFIRTATAVIYIGQPQPRFLKPHNRSVTGIKQLILNKY